MDTQQLQLQEIINLLRSIDRGIEYLIAVVVGIAVLRLVGKILFH